MDGDFEQYEARLATWLNPTAWHRQLEVVKASPKLCNGQPSRFRGVSVLSASGAKEQCNQRCLAWLSEMQNHLRTTFSDGDFFWLPPDHLHLTIADLIAGPIYESSVQEEDDFEHRFVQALDSIRTKRAQSAKPLRWRPAGIVFFEHAIGCVLTPFADKDYSPLVQLREMIYNNDELLALGVKLPRPYIAHFTLGYFASAPTQEKKASWLAHYEDVSSLFLTEREWVVSGAELVSFDDMITYRQHRSGWSLNV